MIAKVDNPSPPPIETCLEYWYGRRQNAQAELASLCGVGSQPPLQCMFDRPKFCKGRMLEELTHNSPTPITDIERRLLWYAAFGRELVCKKGENSSVKASFIQWLITNPSAVSLISTNGICVEGITIEDDLNLANVTVNFPVVLEKSYFRGSINLIDAKMRFLSLEGSTCCDIEASRIKVNGSLRLNNGFQARGQININEANISGDLDCSGGHFKKPDDKPDDKALTLDLAEIRGGVFLNDGFEACGGVSLKGVRITGDLDCCGGHFENYLSAKNSSGQNDAYALDISLAEVKGKICLSVSKDLQPFRAEGHVLAIGMRVNGDFDCTEGRIENSTGTCHAVSIDRSIIGGSVFLRNGFSAHGQVRMFGVKIGNDLDCSGGEFYRTSVTDSAVLETRGAEIGGCVYLCGSKWSSSYSRISKPFITDSWINLDFLNIGNAIIVGKADGGEGKTAVFKGGRVDISNSKIGGLLNWKEVQLTENTELFLDNATVRELITSGQESWPMKNKLSLNDFVYDHVKHNPDDVNTHLEWLKRQKFNSQIYEQLATVLSRSGRDIEAKTIRIAGEDRKRKDTLKWKDLKWKEKIKWREKIWSLILKFTLGYGYSPLRIAYCSLVIVIVGACIFQAGYKSEIIVPTNKEAFEYYENEKTKGKVPTYYPEFNGIVYSFDTFFPIGKLYQQEKWQPLDYHKCNGNREFVVCDILPWYSWLHPVLGWICAALGIAGFTGLIRRS
jgi:hypothetical protein